MQWLELTIPTTSSGIELVEGRLTALGYDSFIVDDQEDFDQFLQENTQYWDYVDEALAEHMKGLSQIRLYLEDGPSAMEAISSLQEQLFLLQRQFPSVDFGSLQIRLSSMQDEDWENNWKQYYQPLPIGERLIVVPKWLQPDSASQRLPILLDPGMIFGTGAHASTQMCMVALEQAIHGGERVLDLGAGSGILSIAALLLGADTALAVDIDPKAEDIARENASYNGLDTPRFTAITGNVLDDSGLVAQLGGPYDLVLANIVADVIIPLAPIAAPLIKESGLFLCSGILETRAEEVIAALTAAGLEVLERRQQEDWVQITARPLQGGRQL